MTTQTPPRECPSPDNPRGLHLWQYVTVTRHDRVARCTYCGKERSEPVEDMGRGQPYVQF